MDDLDDLSSTLPSSWRYTAEGGANLVLSYTGPPHALFTRKVLRLRKKKLGALSITASGRDDGDRFAEEVIAPLLGREFVLRLTRVELEREWVEKVRAMLEEDGIRPVERRDEDELDEGATHAALVEDLVHGEGVLAIEIKPKWGFLPSPSHLDPSSADAIKSSHCRLCMHRHLRTTQSNGISAANDEHETAYCPLDLYSLDPDRVKQALSALWKGWVDSEGQSNNLRIFLSGERLSPTATDITLLDSHFSSAPLAALQSILVPAICTSLLFPRLSSLQSSLHPSSSLLGHPSSLNQPDLEEWLAWIASSTTREERTPREQVLAALFSATFKDCSIFVRVVRGETGWEVEMKAIDLDPKPVENLGKWSKLDVEVVGAFGTALEGWEGVRKCVV